MNLETIQLSPTAMRAICTGHLPICAWYIVLMTSRRSQRRRMKPLNVAALTNIYS